MTGSLGQPDCKAFSPRPEWISEAPSQCISVPQCAALPFPFSYTLVREENLWMNKFSRLFPARQRGKSGLESTGEAVVGPVPGEQLGWWCQWVSSRHHIQLAGMNSPSARCSPPFLLPLNTLQAEDTWPPSRPRAKLSGGHDKMGHQQ